MKKVTILYNNLDFFSSKDLPTPKVSRSISDIYFGDKKGVKETIMLDGDIFFEQDIADCDYFNFLQQRRDELVNAFSQDFKQLIIKEDNDIILEKDFCIINDISFPDQGYKKTLAYSIEIECYDELTHNEFYGIENPVNSTTIEKSEEEVYSIQRSISASGVNTQDGNLNGSNDTDTSSSLQNAIDFVLNLSGEDNVIKPNDASDAKLVLISQSEKIDRIKNSIEVQESYALDKFGSNSDTGVVRYVINKSQPFSSIIQVEISGEIKGGINSNFEDLRNQLKNIDFYQEIIDGFGDEGYNKIPKTINFNENKKVGVISFSILFDNDSTFNDCGVSTALDISMERGEDSVINVSVEGTLSALGPVSKRWDLVSSEFFNKPYDNTLYKSWIHSAAQQEINNFLNNVTLLGEPENSSIEENKKAGELKFSYTFSNKEKPEDFKNLQCSSTVNLRSPKYSVDMNFGGTMDSYKVTRAGFSKGSISIVAAGEYINKTGNETTDKNNALTKLREKINTLFSEIENEFFKNEESLKIGDSVSYNTNNSQASINETREYFDSIV